MSKKRLNEQTSFDVITKATGFTVKLPSGRKVDYEDPDFSSDCDDSCIAQSQIDYPGLGVCDDALASIANMSDQEFNVLVKDITEWRKAFHNFKLLR